MHPLVPFRPIHNAHIKYLEICESNPSLYVWGAPWKLITNKTRELAADLLGCYSNDIAITHNTTEGFNILAHGLKLNKKHEVLLVHSTTQAHLCPGMAYQKLKIIS